MQRKVSPAMVVVALLVLVLIIAILWHLTLGQQRPHVGQVKGGGAQGATPTPDHPGDVKQGPGPKTTTPAIPPTPQGKPGKVK